MTLSRSFKQSKQRIGRILNIKMKNFQYTLDPIQDDQYKCFIDIYMDTKYMFYQQDILSYLKTANYKKISILSFGKFSKVSFQFNMVARDAQGVVDMTNNVWEDFQYVLEMISNEKKY